MKIHYSGIRSKNEYAGMEACRQFEKMIPRYFSDELDNRELDSFLDHLRTCRSCREELSTQFLVLRGLEKLETGETFKLREELESFVAVTDARLARRNALTYISYGTELATLLAAAIFAVLAFALLR